MKTTPMHISSQIRLNKLLRQALSLAAAVSVAGGALSAVAQTAINKSNSYTSLSTPADWSGGVVPGANNIAVWDSGAGTPSLEPLGTNLTFAGIQILNPLGPIVISTITSTNSINTLTNGTAGINMLQAGQSLTMSNNVELNGPQYWQIGNNQTLSLQGGLYRALGSELLFSFDNSASAAAFIQTNVAGSIVQANNINVPLTVGTIGIGTSTGLPLGTYNDVDFAALNQTNQVVPGASVGYANLFGTTAIYAGNPNGPTPTATTALFYDFTNTTSYGVRIRTTTEFLGFRFNNPQTNTAYVYGGLNAVYGGVPAWQVLYSGSSVLDVNAILVTTNAGISPVVFTPGGSARISVGANEMAIFQNNPAAPLVFQSPITQRTTASYVDKYGPGTLDLQAACSYGAGTLIYGGTVLVDGAGKAGTGPVTVFTGGNFEGEGGAANSDAVTVSSGGTNSVLINTANGQFNNSTNLTFNAGTTCLQFIYSNGIAPSATTAPLLIANAGSALTLNSTVNVNVMGGSFSTGQFPLVKYASLAGTGFAALNLNALPPDVFGYLSNNVNNSSIDLVITGVGQPVTWSASGGSGAWDIGQTANWLDGFGNTTNYEQVLSSGENVVFNDSVSGSPITVTLNANVIPASVAFNDSVNSYTVSGTGGIGGSDSLTKTGTGSLTLSTINSFSGGININGGTVNFSALLNLGAGAINFNGGTLQYSGNVDDISTRVVNFNAGGATINVGSANVTYLNPIGNGGAGGLTKAGSGTLTISGTNTFTGNTVVSQGTLELYTNAYIADSSVINVNSGAVLAAAVSGVGLALSSGQTLTGSGQINGIVTNSALSTIIPAGAGITGTLSINGALNISAQSAVDVDVAPTSNDVIAVTGNLTIAVDSVLNVNVIGTLPIGRYVIMTYTGTLTGAGANMVLISNNSGTTVLSLDSSVAGQIAMVVTQGARDVLLWPGTGTSWDKASTLDWLNAGVSWPYTNGDIVTFNDSDTGSTTIDLMTNVQPSLVIVSNTVIPTFTFADGTGLGNGLVTGSASLVKQGTGTLLVQTADNYTGPTTISGGTLQIGSGGIGEVGFGNVTNNGALIFQEGDGAKHYIPGVVGGTGSMTVNVTGGSIVAMTGNNNYSGPTTISSGTLQIGDSLSFGTLGSTTAVTNNGVLMLDRAGSYTLPSTITGSGTLADEGSGTILLGANSLTYLGDTSISNGIVKLGANNQLPNGSSVAGSIGILNLDGGLSSAGTLDLNGFSATVNALSGIAGTVNGTVTDSSTATPTNTLTILTTASTTFNGQITGSKLKLIVLGPATNVDTLTLNPSTVNTFSAGMIISNSAVYLGSDASLLSSATAPGTGPVTLMGTNTILVLDGGQSGAPNGSLYASFTNNVIIPAGGQNVTIYGPCRGTFASTVTGSGTLNYDTTYVRDNVSGSWAGFTGQVVLTGNSTGGNVGFAVTNGLANSTVLMTTDVAFYAESGPVFSIGALAGGDQSCQIEGLESGGPNSGAANETFAIGGLNTSTVYTGGIIDTNINVLKVGTGTWTLNCGGVLTTNVVPDTNTGFNITVIGYGANRLTYNGTTTVSNGVLALVAPAAPINSTNITIASSTAELDASEMGFISNLTTTLPNGATQEVVIDSTFEVFTNQTLGGIGTLNGILQADQGSTLAIGLPTGVFNVTSNNASLSGAVTMNIDYLDTPQCSELAAPSFTINPTATLVVSNIGPGVVNGATFTLFNQPVSGFASVTLPATDPSGTSTYVWQNNLALNGSITLTSGGLTNGPLIKSTYSSGTNLTLSWPVDYQGYTLQVQTNSVTKGLSTNWVNVSGSSSGTNMSFFVNTKTNGVVFYRLIQ